jgi:hypothetical protein
MASKGNKGQPVQVAGIDSIIAALKAELHGEPPPEGWYTVAQIAKMLGIPKQTAEGLVGRKQWECAHYTTRTTDNRTIKVKHYLITQ